MSPAWIGAFIVAIVVGALGFYVVCKVQNPELGKQAFELETAIRKHWGSNTPDFGNVRIYVQEDGVVTLEGTIVIPARKEEAEVAAKATPGVSKVINNIRIVGGGG